MANVPTVSTSVGLPQIIGSWAGSALGGPVGGFIGNALGGAVSGLFGKKKRGPDEGDQIVMRGRALDADVAQKIETGKKYGIHPLTMLGVQSPYVGQSTMSSSGPSFAQALHAFRYTIPDYLSNKGNRVGRSFGNFFRNYKFHKFPERR